jgi:pimeloyl-ACP methyl ester carboxylesterase
VPVTVDVARELGLPGPLTTSAWIFAPRRPAAGVPTVLFAFPGGGYAKAYFHLEVPGHPGYSMGEYLAGRGCYVIACDNLGAGQSSRPKPAATVSWTAMVDANQATVAGVLGLLRSPDFLPGAAPLGECRLVGLGHSLGAGLVTVQQARHGTFDALVVLGRAIVGTHIPAPPEGAGTEPTWKAGSLQREEFAATSEIVDGYYFQRRRTPWQRYLFYWADVPEAVIAADEAAGTTFHVDAARNLAAPGGPGAQAAAAVTVPLLLGFGERDVVQDPRAEVAAYQSATDIQLIVLHRSGHCHNLAGSRGWLWDRIIRFTDGLAAP